MSNRYRKKDNGFYLKLLRGKCSVAVDGGIRFFLKNKIYPDIFVGDFDSTPRLSRKYLSNFEVKRYPTEKDKTDSQLALELALERGVISIDVCGGISTSELDHTLANIFLLDLVNKFNRGRSRSVRARIVEPSCVAYLVDNSQISLKGELGDFVSIIPLESGVRLSYSGLVYPAPGVPLEFGDSLTLRNQLKSGSCRIQVAGKAVVVLLLGSYMPE